MPSWRVFTARMKREEAEEIKAAAEIFIKAAAATKKQMAVTIDKLNADANMLRAEKWDGVLPRYVGGGMPVPFMEIRK